MGADAEDIKGDEGLCLVQEPQCHIPISPPPSGGLYISWKKQNRFKHLRLGRGLK